MNYLANVLIAGDSSNGKRLRPIEAVEKVMETCHIGMRYILPPELEKDIESVMEKINQEGLVKIFRIGWNISYNKSS